MKLCWPLGGVASAFCLCSVPVPSLRVFIVSLCFQGMLIEGPPGPAGPAVSVT